MRGPQLSLWLAELNPVSIQEDHMVFDLVKEFLQNAGQSQMIVQCEQSENELTQLVVQQSILVRNCLDLLSQYSAICSFYPLSSMAQHRSVLYHAWASKLLVTGSVDSCNEVLAEMELNFAPVAINDARVQRTVTFSYRVSRSTLGAVDRDCNCNIIADAGHFERGPGEVVQGLREDDHRRPARVPQPDRKGLRRRENADQ